MILAASGPAIIGVVVACALLLAWALLRAEMGDDAEDDADQP
jgi:hypothetical protein